jgi:carboxymethylenebutenolidase
MKAAGKRFEPVTYDGACHGFMRAGVDPSNTVPGNKTAREEGFKRLTKLLGSLGSPTAVRNTSHATLASKTSSHKEKQASCHNDVGMSM